MKKKLMIGLLVAVLSQVSSRALAGPDEYDDSQSDPLRIAAYLLHPPLYLVEWVFFRPFHYLVSRPGLNKVFGHTPHDEIRVMERRAQEPRTMEPQTSEPRTREVPDERT